MIRLFKSVAEWRAFRDSTPMTSLGFVPTMGALHAGHASLIRRSREENSHTLVSVFLNPTQFNDPEDLKKYPRTLERDLKLAQGAGAQYVFTASPQEMYPDDYRYRVSENEVSRVLEGEHRPGHFDGMLTVVMKLLLLARAKRAYFGEKDFQQLELVRGMASAFFIDTEVVACATLREADGLAMSSRNTQLGEEARRLAPQIYRALQTAPTAAAARTELEQAGFQVDYIAEKFGRRLAAARLGSVRLIDNIPAKEKPL